LITHFLNTRLSLIGHGLTSVEELCKAQQVLIEQHQEAIELLEVRIINLEHDLALVHSVIKDRKNKT